MNTIETLFVPYQLAVKLKELGFDEPCLSHRYSDRVDDFHFLPKPLNNSQLIKENRGWATPTFSQSFRWFREKYNILATIYSNASGYLYEWHDAVGGTHRGWSEYEGPTDGGVWDTYEEAELACLTKLIKIAEAL